MLDQVWYSGYAHLIQEVTHVFSHLPGHENRPFSILTLPNDLLSSCLQKQQVERLFINLSRLFFFLAG